MKFKQSINGDHNMYAEITDSGLEFSDTQEEGYLEYVETVKPTETVMQKYKESYTLDVDMADSTQRIVQTWIPYILEPEGRVAKLVNGKELSFPQQTEYTPDGALMIGFPTRPNSVKLACGYLLIKDTPKPTEGNYRETGILVEDADFGQKIEIVWELIPAIPEQPYDISKLKLKRAMVALGKWDEFLTALKTDADAFEDFNLAITLMSNDPLVLQFKVVCKQLFGFTEAEIDTMLKQCKSDL